MQFMAFFYLKIFIFNHLNIKKEKQQLFIDIFAVTVVIYSFIHSFMHASRLYLGMSIGCLSTTEQERGREWAREGETAKIFKII